MQSLLIDPSQNYPPMKTLLTFSALLFLLIGQVKSQSYDPLFPVTVDKVEGDHQSIFEEIKDLILSKYYTDELREEDLYWAAIEGMLRHISPPETPKLATISTPAEYGKTLNSLKGLDVSLGIKSTYDSKTGSLLVTDINENSPSKDKLELYDRILRINDESLKGLTITKVNELMAGPEGSEAILTVNRDVEILKIKVTRKSFKVSNLEVSLIPARATALIEIHKIYQGLTNEVEAELVQLKKQGYKHIILDLRHNTGGILNEGIRTANLFMTPKQIIVRTKSQSTEAKPIVADKYGYDFNMVVLIDGSTASASEIIVSAFQDHKRATIIGTKTYGKGVIETTYTLSNAYRVKFITSAMYSPLGKTWQSKGILPDFLVEQSNASYNNLKKLPLDKRLSSDIYLSTALKLLK